MENSHPPIILPDEWDRVQTEMARRKSSGRRHNCNSPFAGKLVCADCGEYYGSKVWHSNSKYRRVIWQCNGKFKGNAKCHTPHLYEQDIQRLFMAALSKLYSHRESILDTGRLILNQLTDTTAVDTELDVVLREMEVTAGLVRSCVAENATQAMNQADFQIRYNGYVERYEELRERYTQLQADLEEREMKSIRVSGFLFSLREQEVLPIEFDEKLWNAMVDHVTVHTDERLVFHFKNGTEIVEQL